VLHHPLVVRVAWSLVVLVVALILQYATGSFLLGLLALFVGIFVLNRLLPYRRR
jgi:hypothetical protein